MDLAEIQKVLDSAQVYEDMERIDDRVKQFEMISSGIIHPLQVKYMREKGFKAWGVHPVPSGSGRGYNQHFVTRFHAPRRSPDLVIAYDSFNSNSEIFYGRKISNFERSILVICNIIPEIINQVKNNGFSFITDGRSDYSVNNGAIGIYGRIHTTPDNSEKIGDFLLSIDDCIDKHYNETKIPKKLLERLNS
jgi:hypothetical protein